MRRVAIVSAILLLLALGALHGQQQNFGSGGIATLSNNGAVTNGTYVDGVNDIIFFNTTSVMVGYTQTFVLTVRTQNAGLVTEQSQSNSITAANSSQANTIQYVVPPAGQVVFANGAQQSGGISYGQLFGQLMVGNCAQTISGGPLTGKGTVTQANFNSCTPIHTVAQKSMSGFDAVCWSAAGGSSCPSFLAQSDGFNFTQSQSSPAKGAEINIVVSDNIKDRDCIQAVQFNLVTSATVGSRTMMLSVTTNTGSGSGFQFPQTISIPPSTTAAISFSPGALPGSVTAGGVMWIAAPFYNGADGGVCLSPQDASVNIVTHTAGLDTNGSTGDAYSALVVRWKSRLENN